MASDDQDGLRELMFDRNPDDSPERLVDVLTDPESWTDPILSMWLAEALSDPVRLATLPADEVNVCLANLMTVEPHSLRGNDFRTMYPDVARRRICAALRELDPNGPVPRELAEVLQSTMVLHAAMLLTN